MGNRRVKKELNPWVYQGVEIKSIDQMPENTFGFVYVINNNVNGHRYIGKKCIYSFSKEIIKVPGKGKRLKKQVILHSKESNWQSYFGSSKEFLKEIKEYGEENFFREILWYCPTKALLTYYETKEQFLQGAIEPNTNFVNDNILGKFYRKIFLDKSEDSTIFSEN